MSENNGTTPEELFRCDHFPTIANISDQFMTSIILTLEHIGIEPHGGHLAQFMAVLLGSVIVRHSDPEDYVKIITDGALYAVDMAHKQHGTTTMAELHAALSAASEAHKNSLN